jgi:hypothetical protein
LDPAWRRAVSEDAHVRPRAGKRTWPTGAAFAWLPDPFAALDALGELGYALEDFTDHGGRDVRAARRAHRSGVRPARRGARSHRRAPACPAALTP